MVGVRARRNEQAVVHPHIELPYLYGSVHTLRQ